MRCDAIRPRDHDDEHSACESLANRMKYILILIVLLDRDWSAGLHTISANNWRNSEYCVDLFCYVVANVSHPYVSNDSRQIGFIGRTFLSACYSAQSVARVRNGFDGWKRFGLFLATRE